MSRRDDPDVVIPNLLEKNDPRQRTFKKDRDRSRRKYNTRIQKVANAAAGSESSPRGGAGRVFGFKRQNERKKPFSVGMIGAPPPAWTLRTKPDKSDLPAPPEPYYESPGERPKCRFSDPEMFDDVGLSPVGRARLKRSKHQPNGLPPGWKEHFIGDTFSKTDAQANLENSVFLDDKNAEIVDKGRVYFYHEETGRYVSAHLKGVAHWL